MSLSQRTRRTTLAALLACAAFVHTSSAQSKQNAQPRSDSRKTATNRGEGTEAAARRAREVRDAVAALKDAAESARSFEDVYDGVRAQSEAADALWPFDVPAARAILRRAWDAANAPGAEEKVEGFGTSEDPREDAQNTLTTARAYLVKTAAKHDPRMGRELMREFERGIDARAKADAGAGKPAQQTDERALQLEELTETDEPARRVRSLSQAGLQRLYVAQSLMEDGDFGRAAETAAPLAAGGASLPLLKFVFDLRARDERDADALYARLLEVTLADPSSGVNDVLLLSTPFVSPDLVATSGAGGAANFTPLRYADDGARRAAATFPASSRLAFYETASAVLLRQRVAGGDAARADEDAAALYFTINRLLPFFERDAPPLAHALNARLSALAAEVAASRRAFLDSQSGVRSLTPKNAADPLETETNLIKSAGSAADRDLARLSAVLTAARGGLWERARGLAEQIEETESRRDARLAISIQQVMTVGRAYDDAKADDFARASAFVRAADVPAEVRGVGLAQASELAARAGKRAEADALLAEAAGDAAQADAGARRVAALALVTLSAGRAGSPRAWELLPSLVRAANGAGDFEWGAVNFVFTLGGARKIELATPLPAPSLTEAFKAAARLDSSRAIAEARSLDDEVLRAYALVEAARAALSKDVRGRESR